MWKVYNKEKQGLEQIDQSMNSRLDSVRILNTCISPLLSERKNDQKWTNLTQDSLNWGKKNW